jgi:hypothetical protein
MKIKSVVPPIQVFPVATEPPSPQEKLKRLLECKKKVRYFDQVYYNIVGPDGILMK